MKKSEFKIGDEVMYTPSSRHSEFYGMRGVVTEVNYDDEGCHIDYTDHKLVKFNDYDRWNVIRKLTKLERALK